MISQAILIRIEKAILCLLGIFPIAAWAQQDNLVWNAKIAVGASANAYRGDLGDAYDQWAAACHVSFLMNHQNRLHGGLHGSLGTITGEAFSSNTLDLDMTYTPNTFFRTKFLSVHYTLQYDIIRRKFLTVYISQGLGLMRFMPQDQFNQPLQNQQNTRASNETYSNVTAILPTQLGIDYYFPNRFGVGLKAGWLNTTTDYLDNTSQLGSRQGSDNVLQFQFLLLVPASF